MSAGRDSSGDLLIRELSTIQPSPKKSSELQQSLLLKRWRGLVVQYYVHLHRLDQLLLELNLASNGTFIQQFEWYLWTLGHQTTATKTIPQQTYRIYIKVARSLYPVMLRRSSISSYPRECLRKGTKGPPMHQRKDLIFASSKVSGNLPGCQRCSRRQHVWWWVPFGPAALGQ